MSWPRIPEELLEIFDSSSADQATWGVLEDWLLEHGAAELPREGVLPRIDGVSFRARWRSGFATHGYLRYTRPTGPSLYELEGLLRSPGLRLLTELRLEANWAGPRVMLFGLGGVNQPPQPPPALVLPALLEATLASAPRSLRALGVWIPQNESWGTNDDCSTQLAALTRQRPLTAKHLTLRAPRKGVMPFLNRLAPGWETITLGAPLTVADEVALHALARGAPQVTFRVLGQAASTASAPNLRWLPDDDHLRLTALGTGATWDLVPGRSLQNGEATAVLRELGVELRSELGLWELVPISLPANATLTVNGEVLKAPLAVTAGMTVAIYLKSAGWPHPGQRASPDKVQFFGGPYVPRDLEERFRFDQP